MVLDFFPPYVYSTVPCSLFCLVFNVPMIARLIWAAASSGAGRRYFSSHLPSPPGYIPRYHVNSIHFEKKMPFPILARYSLTTITIYHYMSSSPHHPSPSHATTMSNHSRAKNKPNFIQFYPNHLTRPNDPEWPLTSPDDTKKRRFMPLNRLGSSSQRQSQRGPLASAKEIKARVQGPLAMAKGHLVRVRGPLVVD